MIFAEKKHLLGLHLSFRYFDIEKEFYIKTPKRVDPDASTIYLSQSQHPLTPRHTTSPKHPKNQYSSENPHKPRTAVLLRTQLSITKAFQQDSIFYEEHTDP